MVLDRPTFEIILNVAWHRVYNEERILLYEQSRVEKFRVVSVSFYCLSLKEWKKPKAIRWGEQNTISKSVCVDWEPIGFTDSMCKDVSYLYADVLE